MGQFPDGDEGERYDQCAENGTENSHAQVVVIQVLVAGLVEREAAVVAGQFAGEADQHFAERWMHVEEERPIDVPGGHLSEVSLIPADMVGLFDLVDSRDKGAQKGETEQKPPVDVQIALVQLVLADLFLEQNFR